MTNMHILGVDGPTLIPVAPVRTPPLISLLKFHYHFIQKLIFVFHFVIPQIRLFTFLFHPWVVPGWTKSNVVAFIKGSF